MPTIGWILAILVIIAIAAVVWAVAAYNGFVRQRNMIQESWRQIDVELNRRYELIPNLIETVRAFASHERNTLEEVTRLRNQAAALAGQGGAIPSQQRAEVEGALSGAVHNLLVSVEAYPELRSNQNFLELQRELSETEDRIAAGRRFYNANVRNYNTRVESIPSNFIANGFHFEKAAYFEVNDTEVRRAPEVSFGEISYRGDPPRVAEQSRDARPEVAASDPNALPNPQAYDARDYTPPTVAPEAQPAPPRYQQPPQQGQGYVPPNS